VGKTRQSFAAVSGPKFTKVGVLTIFFQLLIYYILLQRYVGSKFKVGPKKLVFGSQAVGAGVNARGSSDQIFQIAVISVSKFGLCLFDEVRE